MGQAQEHSFDDGENELKARVERRKRLFQSFAVLPASVGMIVAQGGLWVAELARGSQLLIPSAKAELFVTLLSVASSVAALLLAGWSLRHRRH